MLSVNESKPAIQVPKFLFEAGAAIDSKTKQAQRRNLLV